jgi:hypothetical protein
VERQVAAGTALLDRPADDGASVADLEKGDRFLMLDDSLGWAWGYAGKDRRVGYVRSDALRP